MSDERLNSATTRFSHWAKQFKSNSARSHCAFVSICVVAILASLCSLQNHRLLSSAVRAVDEKKYLKALEPLTALNATFLGEQTRIRAEVIELYCHVNSDARDISNLDVDNAAAQLEKMNVAAREPEYLSSLYWRSQAKLVVAEAKIARGSLMEAIDLIDSAIASKRLNKHQMKTALTLEVYSRIELAGMTDVASERNQHLSEAIRTIERVDPYMDNIFLQSLRISHLANVDNSKSDAIRLADKLVQRHPTHILSLLVRALTQEQFGSFEAAGTDYVTAAGLRSLVPKGTERPDPWAALTCYHFAALMLRTSPQTDIKQQVCSRLLADAEMMFIRLARSKSDYARNLGNVAIAKARLLFDQDRMRDSLNQYDIAFEYFERTGPANSILYGLALNTAAWLCATEPEYEDLPKAIRHAELALDLVPTHRKHAVLHTLAIAQAKSSNTHEAKSYMKRAIDMAPDKATRVRYSKDLD